MTLTKTPICNFGEKAKDFNLLSTENKKVSLGNVKGERGTLIMFICNHCPYVKAIIKDIVQDVKFLESLGIKSTAIMSNDVKNYPEDSFENMISFAKLHDFSFPYLIDETQKVAKEYGAVCTPDFFGYNGNLELQYRGRIKELKDLDSELETLFATTQTAFESRSFEQIGAVLETKTEMFDLVRNKIQKQVERTRSEESSPKNTTLYFSLLLETKDLLTAMMNLLEEYYQSHDSSVKPARLNSSAGSDQEE